MGFIYIITNTVNNLVYVGQTKRAPHERWGQHLNSARVIIRGQTCEETRESNSYKKARNSPLYNAMAAHGIDNFTMNLLEEVDDNDLDNAEITQIRKFDCIHPR